MWRHYAITNTYFIWTYFNAIIYDSGKSHEYIITSSNVAAKAHLSHGGMYKRASFNIHRSSHHYYYKSYTIQIHVRFILWMLLAYAPTHHVKSLIYDMSFNLHLKRSDTNNDKHATRTMKNTSVFIYFYRRNSEMTFSSLKYLVFGDIKGTRGTQIGDKKHLNRTENDIKSGSTRKKTVTIFFIASSDLINCRKWYPMAQNKIK